MGLKAVSFSSTQEDERKGNTIGVAIALASLGISAASSVYGYASEAAAAEATNDYNAKRYIQNAQLARGNYNQAIAQLQRQGQQERASIGKQESQNATEGFVQRGKTTTSAANRGVRGQSVSDLLTEYARLEAQNQAAFETNLEWAKEQNQQKRMSAYANAVAQTVGAQYQPQTGPSFLATGLQIGTSALNAYSFYENHKDNGSGGKQNGEI